MDFGEIVGEARLNGVPVVKVELRQGEILWRGLHAVRVLDNNLVGKPRSPEDRSLIAANTRGFKTVAEIDQALQILRPAAAQVLLNERILGADDVLRAHQHWFGPAFGWGGRLRKQEVEVGRENYATPSPTVLRREMSDFDRFLRRTQTCLSSQTISLKNSSVWFEMAKVYFELCRIHPFRDGNGRLSRLLNRGAFDEVRRPKRKFVVG